MALVRLSDVIVPEVFSNYMINNTVVGTEVFDSGIVRMDPEMSAKLAGGGRLFQHPVWRDLDNDAPVIGTDNPADVITPKKLGTFKHQFIRMNRNQAWQTADLVAQLAGSDPMKRISERVTAYWNRYFNTLTTYVLNGVINDNVANDSGDMVHDISALTGTTTVGAATVNKYQLHAGAILEAKQTMGDRASGLTTIIMHSRLFTNLQLQNLISFVPNSDGKIMIPMYLGYRVIVTDTVPVTVDGADLIYTSYLCGPGVVGFGESPVQNPVAVEREELQGNGSGVETLVTRRQFAMHVYGFNFADGSTAGEVPTDAELQLAANWDRAFPERKQISFVAIKSKNG